MRGERHRRIQPLPRQMGRADVLPFLPLTGKSGEACGSMGVELTRCPAVPPTTHQFRPDPMRKLFTNWWVPCTMVDSFKSRAALLTDGLVLSEQYRGQQDVYPTPQAPGGSAVRHLVDAEIVCTTIHASYQQFRFEQGALTLLGSIERYDAEEKDLDVKDQLAQPILDDHKALWVLAVDKISM